MQCYILTLAVVLAIIGAQGLNDVSDCITPKLATPLFDFIPNLTS